MAGLSQRLAGHRLVGLDTSVFIYHFEAHPLYLPLTRELLSLIIGGKCDAVSSTVTLMELTVRPLQEGRRDLALAYEWLLDRFPQLTLAERHAPGCPPGSAAQGTVSDSIQQTRYKRVLPSSSVRPRL